MAFQLCKWVKPAETSSNSSRSALRVLDEVCTGTAADICCRKLRSFVFLGMVCVHHEADPRSKEQHAVAYCVDLRCALWPATLDSCCPAVLERKLSHTSPCPMLECHLSAKRPCSNAQVIHKSLQCGQFPEPQPQPGAWNTAALKAQHTGIKEHLATCHRAEQPQQHSALTARLVVQAFAWLPACSVFIGTMGISSSP